MTEISGFYSSVFNHYSATNTVGRSTEHIIGVGEHKILLKIIGDELASSIIPAFAHLELIENSTPDLTVFIWDSSTNNQKGIKFPWQPEEIREHGFVKSYSNERYKTGYIHGSHGLQLIDLVKNQAYFWITDTSDLPYYEKAAPIRTILQWWLRTKGVYLTHAAAIGSDESGVLLVGKGGSGKTTTAITSLSSKLKYLSDDYCLTSRGQENKVLSLYSTAKIEQSTSEQFPLIKKALSDITPIRGDKNLYYLYGKYQNTLINELPLKALIAPQISEKKSALIEEISSIEMMKALIPSTIFQLAASGKNEYEHFSNLVKVLPSYRFHLSQNLESNIRLLETFINGLK